MKRTSAFFSLLAAMIFAASSVSAQFCCDSQDYSFYLKVGSGVSFSESAHVKAPPIAWDPALQGYNAKLGNEAIGGVGIGCEIMRLVDVEVSLSTRSTFKYRKYQTSTTSGESYTREFDLDVTPLLISLTLLGRDIDCLNRDLFFGNIYPVAGLGVGVSNLTLTNFRTTGLPPTGSSAPFASFSAENQHTRCWNTTYTALVGLEYNYNDCWAITTGYRWLDAGTFKGPRYLRVANGSAVDISGQQWKMRFRANEWFIEFKYFL